MAKWALLLGMVFFFFYNTWYFCHKISVHCRKLYNHVNYNVLTTQLGSCAIAEDTIKPQASASHLWSLDHASSGTALALWVTTDCP